MKAPIMLASTAIQDDRLHGGGWSGGDPQVRCGCDG